MADDLTPKSDYPELKLPIDGWKSNIPEHLLASADPEMKWLMEEMSKNTQATNFSVTAAVDTNAQVRKTNGRLKGAEQNVIDLKADVAILKEKMSKIDPMANAWSTAWSVATNKVFLVIFAMSVLFLLGFNRDVLITLFKAWFG